MDVWTIVLLLQDNNTPVLRTVTRAEVECYETGSDSVEEIDEVIVLRTTVDFTEVSWRVSRGGRWRLKHKVHYYRDVVED